MKRQTTTFALCLKNTGNEASLILGKVYRVVPDARAAKDDLVRIIDESGEDYLFHKKQFALASRFSSSSTKEDSCASAGQLTWHWSRWRWRFMRAAADARRWEEVKDKNERGLDGG